MLKLKLKQFDISTISETVGSKRTLVCQWLHGIPAGEDVSELLDAHIWCRDMVLNCAGIAYYLESPASVVDRRLKGLSREDAEAVLREMDKHARRKPIPYNYQGESLSASAISQRLGLSAQTLPRIIRTYKF